MELIVKGTDLQELIGKLNQITSKPVRTITDKQFKLAYRFKRISDQLYYAYKEIDKKRLALIKKMGVEDKKANTTSVPEDKIEEFNKVLDGIKEQPVNIEFDSIPLEMLTTCGIEFTLMELANIQQFIGEEV